MPWHETNTCRVEGTNITVGAMIKKNETKASQQSDRLGLNVLTARTDLSVRS